MSNLAVFREIFKECSIFAKKVYTILQDHDDISPNKRKGSGALDDGSSRKKRKKSDKDGPKKPLSSYMIFVREERSNVVNKHPDAKFPEIGKILADRWRNLSDTEKQKYQDLAKQDKDRYQTEVDIHHAGLPHHPDHPQMQIHRMQHEPHQPMHHHHQQAHFMEDDSTDTSSSDSDEDEEEEPKRGKKQKHK